MGCNTFLIFAFLVVSKITDGRSVWIMSSSRPLMRILLSYSATNIQQYYSRLEMGWDALCGLLNY